MKRYLYIILGSIILFPTMVADTFGVSMDTFRNEVYRPDNLPASQYELASPEAKINHILHFATDLILYASGSVAVLLLVIGGIRYVMSFGNEEQQGGAKKTIQYALIGLVVVIFAYAIVTNIIDLIYRTTV